MEIRNAFSRTRTGTGGSPSRPPAGSRDHSDYLGIEPPDPFTMALTHTLDLVKTMFESVELTRRPQWLPNLDLADVVQWFLSDTPTEVPVAAGAVLRRTHSEGNHLVFQFFLDGQNQICCYPDGKPYGRRLLVSSIGPELASKLDAGNYLVIFN
jgi:hypothetical protein